jgi:hypothetical protein
VLAELRLPAHELAAGLAQHGFAHRVDQPALFGQADELHRRHHAALGVQPAHQRFHAHHAPAGEVHHGLVDHVQLVVLQRTAQVVFQGGGAHHPFVHRIVEQHPAPAPGTLGFVHRHVGVAQQGLGQSLQMARPAFGCGVAVRDLGAVDDDPDAGCALHWRAAQQVGLGQVGEQPVGDGGHGRCVDHPVEHDHEFVAADACGDMALQVHAHHRVAGAQCVLQTFGDLAQQIVAAGVPQGVVDLLEAVKVHEQDREAITTVALGMRDRTLQPLHHHRAIGQLGQRVGACVGTQLLLQHAALGDVCETGDHAADVTVHVTLRFGVDQQPAQLALRRVHTDGLVEQRHAAAQRAHGGMFVDGVVAAVLTHGAPARVECTHVLHLSQAQAQQAFSGPVAVDDGAGRGLHHHTGRQGSPQRLQLALLMHARGDIGGHAHEAGQAAGLVVHRSQVDVEPDVTAIAAPTQPLIAQTVALCQGLQQPEAHRGVFTRVTQQLVHSLTLHIVWRPARGAFECSIDPLHAVVGVGDQHDGRRAFGHQRQALHVGRLRGQAPHAAAHGARGRLHHRDGQQAQQGQQTGQAPMQAAIHGFAARLGRLEQAGVQLLGRSQRRQNRRVQVHRLQAQARLCFQQVGPLQAFGALQQFGMPRPPLHQGLRLRRRPFAGTGRVGGQQSVKSLGVRRRARQQGRHFLGPHAARGGCGIQQHRHGVLDARDHHPLLAAQFQHLGIHQAGFLLTMHQPALQQHRQGHDTEGQVHRRTHIPDAPMR